MKTSRFLLLIVFIISGLSVKAGEIRGRVLDADSKSPVEFVTVLALHGEEVVASTTTSSDGYYSLKPLKVGSYSVRTLLVGYQPSLMNEVTVNDALATTVNFNILSTLTSLPIVDIRTFTHPLIDPAQVSTMRVIETEDVENSPYSTPQQIATIVPGVSDSNEDGELNMRGGRSTSTQYIVDGIRMSGPFAMPKSSIRDITVLTGGIPAMYGDATGGIIIITTKGYIGR